MQPKDITNFLNTLFLYALFCKSLYNQIYVLDGVRCPPLPDSARHTLAYETRMVPESNITAGGDVPIQGVIADPQWRWLNALDTLIDT